MPTSSRTPSFSPTPVDRSSVSLIPWLIAGVAVLLIVGAILLKSHGDSGPRGVHGPLPLDPHASDLTFSAIQMSESTSLSGGKSTFIDGQVKNTGAKTITGVTVQVLFSNDMQLPPQVETLPLTLIRTREPYVDTESLGAAPLTPGSEREFRLIFEDISSNWNQQLPEIHAVRILDK